MSVTELDSLFNVIIDHSHSSATKLCKILIPIFKYWKLYVVYIPLEINISFTIKKSKYMYLYGPNILWSQGIIVGYSSENGNSGNRITKFTNDFYCIVLVRMIAFYPKDTRFKSFLYVEIFSFTFILPWNHVTSLLGEYYPTKEKIWVFS